MTMSPDPAARERSIAAIRDKANHPENVAGLGARASTKHGAQSQQVAPLAEGYLAELKREFPTASERVLLLQARRLARLDLIARFEDEKGTVLRNRKRGEAWPVSEWAERMTGAFIKTHTDLEAQAREAASANARLLADDLAASRAAWERHDNGSEDT